MATKKPATDKKPATQKAVVLNLEVGHSVQLADGRIGTVDSISATGLALVKVSPKLREWVSIEELKAA